MKQARFELFFYTLIGALLLILVGIARGQTDEIVASGGQFRLEKQVVVGGGNLMSQGAMNQLYLNKMVCENCRNTHEVSVPFLRPYFMRASAIFSQTIFRLV
jgi:hypothetical protein